MPRITAGYKIIPHTETLPWFTSCGYIYPVACYTRFQQHHSA